VLVVKLIVEVELVAVETVVLLVELVH